MKLRVYRTRSLSGRVAKACGLTTAQKRKIETGASVISGIFADAVIEGDEAVMRRAQKFQDSLVDLLRFCKEKRRR